MLPLLLDEEHQISFTATFKCAVLLTRVTMLYVGSLELIRLITASLHTDQRHHISLTLQSLATTILPSIYMSSMF